MSQEREKALELALAAIDKQFGKGSVMRMGEKGSMAIEAVPDRGSCARPGARRRRSAAWPSGRDLRSRVVG